MLHEHMTRLDPVSVATQRIHGLSELPPEGVTRSGTLIARAASAAVLEPLPSVQETRSSLKMAAAAPIQTHHRLRVFLAGQLEQSKTSKVLLQYILASARLPVARGRAQPTEPRPDGLLFVQDEEVRMRAIEWRINRFCTMCKCTGCGERFRRSCVDGCGSAYGRPLVASEERLLWRDVSANDRLTLAKYHRPDAYLNHRQYGQFRRLMVTIDRRLRRMVDADVVAAEPERDLSRQELDQRTKSRRHEPDMVIAEEEEPKWEKGVPEGREVDMRRLTDEDIHGDGPLPLIPLPALPPGGCATSTRVVDGVFLPFTVEEYAYAQLDRSHYRMKLNLLDDMEFERVYLKAPNVKGRVALLAELDRRARGQGFERYDPASGQIYD
ncbi:hypothetical protein OC835_007788, partial [Tilletia horrida]